MTQKVSYRGLSVYIGRDTVNREFKLCLHHPAIREGEGGERRGTKNTPPYWGTRGKRCNIRRKPLIYMDLCRVGQGFDDVSRYVV